MDRAIGISTNPLLDRSCDAFDRACFMAHLRTAGIRQPGARSISTSPLVAIGCGLELLSCCAQRPPSRTPFSSGETEGVIVPSVPADNSLRWRVRMFDQRTSFLRESALTRTWLIRSMPDVRLRMEALENDAQCSARIEMEAIPRSDLAEPEHRLWLGNRDALEDMGSAGIAPGHPPVHSPRA